MSSTYAHLIDSIFGTGSVNGAAAAKETNLLVAALDNPQFATFTNNFTARLKRLHERYASQSSRTALLVQVNETASAKNWQGAFAELTAIDWFTSNGDFLISPPILDVSIAGTRTLTSHFGNKGPANLDLHFAEEDVFSDVKVLQDNVAAILAAAYRQVAWPSHMPLVGADYPHDMTYESLQMGLKTIVAELNAAIAGGKQPTRIQLNIVPEVTIRIDWLRRSLATESSYNPYRHAQECHELPFLHAKKFLVDCPSFLTFVVFPWFNNKISLFGDTNRIFYRSLARRMFCQYQADTTPFSRWNAKYSGSETISQVSQHLSGLCFLEDTSVHGTNPESANASGYWFENPNALHRVPRLFVDNYLQSLSLSGLDDFAHDNY